MYQDVLVVKQPVNAIRWQERDGCCPACRAVFEADELFSDMGPVIEYFEDGTARADLDTDLGLPETGAAGFT